MQYNTAIWCTATESRIIGRFIMGNTKKVILTHAGMEKMEQELIEL